MRLCAAGTSLAVRPPPRSQGVFELLAGHRRYVAARQAGCDRVPVTVRYGADTFH
ncbi:hypothetical protein ETD83_10740 [Actinomadura soli]|uniref:ParB-like N-terminal domain-containing protein n=1 Tax=Actinomadura soli TaxID=2508997 RepID=A0A5C4JFJ6_9ACTN|nr:ParB/RepB/Spo0J family partition protein [Actinomadura soli]TMR03377.1 hypothetical protein ETD83_10740 [Actinomadura soli]